MSDIALLDAPELAIGAVNTSKPTDIVDTGEPVVVEPKPWALVVHQRPDTDALVCLWAANRFIVVNAPSRIFFIPSGTTGLPAEDEAMYNVLYMDVGGGPCDQHGKQLKRGSSFQLVMQEYGLHDTYPALASFLELTIATDNVEKIDPMSIHYVLKGLPWQFNEGGEIDWNQVCNFAFIMFDTIYSLEEQKLLTKKRYAELRTMRECEFVLSNGYNLACVHYNPEFRECAFDRDADVVVWFSKRRKKGTFEVGIQVNRKSPLMLRTIVIALRNAEAEARGVTLTRDDAATLGILDSVPGWFLHDSLKLVACGTRSHPLTGDEFTYLKTHEILHIVGSEIAALPRRQ